MLMTAIADERVSSLSRSKGRVMLAMKEGRLIATTRDDGKRLSDDIVEFRPDKLRGRPKCQTRARAVLRAIFPYIRQGSSHRFSNFSPLGQVLCQVSLLV